MSKILSISLPEELVEKIDSLARGDYASRSDFIRETLVRRVKGQRVIDEWADDGYWQTVVDFQEINRDGVPIEEVIESLKLLCD